jgi:peptidoglycan/xylan/chitin deacetylase (PgdA/CDA1 family)
VANRKLVTLIKGLILFVLIAPWLGALAMGAVALKQNANLRSLSDLLTREREKEPEEVTPPAQNYPVTTEPSEPTTYTPSTPVTATPAGPETPGTVTPPTYTPPSTPTYTPPTAPTYTPPKTSTVKPPKIKNNVYLTFSGGPSAQTIKILDVLKKNKVKASFFVSATNYAKRGEVMRRIIKDGHTLGIESYARNSALVYTSLSSCVSDYESIYKLASDETSATIRFYRFLGGSDTSKASREVISSMAVWLETRSMSYYDWNVTGGESASKPPKASKIAETVRKRVNLSAGEKIVLLHDAEAYKTTPSAVGLLIKSLKKEGHSFKKITKATVPIHR